MDFAGKGAICRIPFVELGGVNGVKRGKSHHNLTAAQAAIKKRSFRKSVLLEIMEEKV